MLVVAQHRAERVFERLDARAARAARRAARANVRPTRSARRRALGAGGEDVGGESPAPGAGLDHEERDRARRARATSRRAHARPARRRADPLRGWSRSRARRARPARPGEEPTVAVERELDERVERDRSLPPDPFDDLVRALDHLTPTNLRRQERTVRLWRRRLPELGSDGEGELADAGDDLRVDADDDGHGDAQADGDGERGGIGPDDTAASGRGRGTHFAGHAP